MTTDLTTEALANLEAFVRTGLRGFALKAYDRLRETGMTETSLGRVEEWDAAFVGELYSYLASE